MAQQTKWKIRLPMYARYVASTENTEWSCRSFLNLKRFCLHYQIAEPWKATMYAILMTSSSREGFLLVTAWLTVRLCPLLVSLNQLGRYPRPHSLSLSPCEGWDVPKRRAGQPSSGPNLMHPRYYRLLQGGIKWDTLIFSVLPGCLPTSTDTKHCLFFSCFDSKYISRQVLQFTVFRFGLIKLLFVYFLCPDPMLSIQ